MSAGVSLLGLVSSEWLRARSRRLVRVLALVALAGIVLAIVIATAQSQMRLADLPSILRGISFIAMLIGLVIGASSVGASWQSGTMTTILTWEPRRVRVALVRAGVVALTVVTLVAILLGVFVGLFAIGAGVRGVTATPAGWGSELLRLVMSVSLLAGAMSVIGGAIAMLGRNTAAALGGVFVYITVLEGVLRGLRPGLGRYLLGDNIATVLSPDGLRVDGSLLSPARGAIAVAAYAVVLLTVSTASFRMRDVQ